MLSEDLWLLFCCKKYKMEQVGKSHWEDIGDGLWRLYLADLQDGLTAMDQMWILNWALYTYDFWVLQFTSFLLRSCFQKCFGSLFTYVHRNKKKNCTMKHVTKMVKENVSIVVKKTYNRNYTNIIHIVSCYNPLCFLGIKEKEKNIWEHSCDSGSFVRRGISVFQ